MKKIALLLLTGLAFLCCGKDFQIYKDGKPQAVIVPLQPNHRFAGTWANDFSTFAEKCTGTPLKTKKNLLKVLKTICF